MTARAPPDRSPGAGLMGAVAGTLHPWQGELLILVVVLAELVRWREHAGWGRLALPALTVALTGLPLVYYLALGRLDLSWVLAREAACTPSRSRRSSSASRRWRSWLLLGYRGSPARLPRADDTDLASGGAADLPALGDRAGGVAAARLRRDHHFRSRCWPSPASGRAGLQRLPRARLVSGVVLALATIPANAYALAIAHTYTVRPPATPTSSPATSATR